jgi:hypothetical protein
MATIASAINTSFTPAAGDFIASITGGSANLMRRNTSSSPWALVQPFSNGALVISNPVAGADYMFVSNDQAVVQADQ